MIEPSIDAHKAAGLCGHGNEPSTCGTCQTTELTQAEALVHQEMKEGLPVISAEDYVRFYNTDIRAAGADTAVTFNFQGFVKEEREGYIQGTFYKDTMATNGILKAEGHEGIHVSTDGVIDYSASGNYQMKSLEDVGEYDIYIKVPGKLQVEKMCVVRYESCTPESEFDGDSEELERTRSEDGYIVMRLKLEPREDKLARQKAELIHNQIVRFVERGGALHEIQDRTRSLENRLENISEEDFPTQKKLLESE